MTAMPAEKWPLSDAEIHEIEELNQLDDLIETVAYYRELTQEYPTTAFYHRMLESSQRDLREVEKRSRVRSTRLTHFSSHG